MTEKWRNVCLFERREGGVGFVFFGAVVLALVPAPTLDSLRFIWTPAQTFDLSKWVANPTQSYCRAPAPAMLPPSGLKGELNGKCNFTLLFFFFFYSADKHLLAFI